MEFIFHFEDTMKALEKLEKGDFAYFYSCECLVMIKEKDDTLIFESDHHKTFITDLCDTAIKISNGKKRATIEKYGFPGQYWFASCDGKYIGIYEKDEMMQTVTTIGIYSVKEFSQMIYHLVNAYQKILKKVNPDVTYEKEFGQLNKLKKQIKLS
ncbi:hypothetical protein ACJ2A9_18985 [Anaerobacillus sp. MEB173]|uniref:hypothetical protein n=1 Tax=Anaerobacillus sp. MEB173 TaxID=3383345 RepID=UPI003F921EE4